VQVAQSCPTQLERLLADRRLPFGNNPGGIGLVMNRLAQLSPTEPGTGQPRSERRAALSIACEVRQGTRSWQRVVLEDLSASGFRITGLAHPDTAKNLSIRIPGMQLFSARIRWIDGRTVGCAFSTALHVAVFEHLVRTAGAA
jgi:PilZ domain